VRLDASQRSVRPPGHQGGTNVSLGRSGARVAGCTLRHLNLMGDWHDAVVAIHEETGTDGSVGRVGSADYSAREKRDVWALGLDVRPANGRPLLFTFVQGIL